MTPRLIEQIESLLNETDMEEDVQVKVLSVLTLIQKETQYIPSEEVVAAMDDLDTIINQVIDDNDDDDEVEWEEEL